MGKCEGCFGSANGDCDYCPYNVKGENKNE